MGVIKERGLLTRYYGAGSGGMSLHFFRVDDKVRTSDLAEVLGSICERQQIPKD